MPMQGEFLPPCHKLPSSRRRECLSRSCGHADHITKEAAWSAMLHPHPRFRPHRQPTAVRPGASQGPRRPHRGLSSLLRTSGLSMQSRRVVRPSRTVTNSRPDPCPDDDGFHWSSVAPTGWTELLGLATRHIALGYRSSSETLLCLLAIAQPTAAEEPTLHVRIPSRQPHHRDGNPARPLPQLSRNILHQPSNGV